MKKQWDILVVDDEPVVLDAVVKICSAEGFSVDYSSDAADALKKFERNEYTLIICDIMMPVLNGFDLLNEIYKRKISSSLIMTTGYSTVENAVKSLYSGAIDYIPKPFTADEIVNSVLRGMKYIQLLKSAANNKDKADSMVFVPCPAKYYRLGYSSWAAKENTGSLLVGATDLFIKSVENVTSIELWKIDDEVIQGNNCAHIVDKEERVHPLLSPLSGRIIEVNEEIKTNVSLPEKDPYFKGWFYRIIPSDSEYELKNLINCSSDRY